MTTTHDHRADVLDEALDRLAGYSFTDGPGMATHGPMGAEAFAGLGHDDDVADWVEAYKASHEPIPEPPANERLDLADAASWQPALGDPSRLADWRDGFRRSLADEPWADVLRTWLPRLAPGYAGAFTHGLIRTAHAVRIVQLRPEPSAQGLAELATALAYWAGTYRALPGDAILRGTTSLADALAQVPRPDQPWTPVEAGMFTRVGELDGFAESVGRLAPPAAIDQGLSELTATLARLMIARPDAMPFGLVHAVTPVAGVRTLLPYLDPGDHRLVYGYLWRVDAAIVAGFVPSPVDAATLAPAGDDPPEMPTPPDLVTQAAEHRDPHVVKFTATCLSENALAPDPAYLLAAQHVIHKTPPL